MNFMSQLYNLQKKIRKISVWVKLMILLDLKKIEPTFESFEEFIESIGE